MRKVVGTSGAVKRIISGVNTLVNHKSMCLKVSTCKECLVTLVLKVIIWLCVCHGYFSQCLL